MIFDKELDQIMTQLESISHTDAKTPSISSGVLIQEAFNLYGWVQSDIQALTQYGMPPELPNNMLLTAKACAEIQAQWFTVQHSKSKALKIWEETLNQALVLREELLHDYSFAFRLNGILMRKIEEIKKGSGEPDLIMDLSNLLGLGNREIPLLNQVGFNTELLVQAEGLVEVMGQQLARARNTEHDKQNTQLLRNKAMFRLQYLLTELRSFGNFAFKNNPERLEGYKLQYKGRKKHSGQ